METNTELYKEDFFAWAQATATLIRAGSALARGHASAQTCWWGRPTGVGEGQFVLGLPQLRS